METVMTFSEHTEYKGAFSPETLEDDGAGETELEVRELWVCGVPNLDRSRFTGSSSSVCCRK